jgi:hypothetical protein
MAPPPGPKELMLRAMREDNASRRPSPSKTELRAQVANIKGGGGRKKKGAKPKTPKED